MKVALDEYKGTPCITLKAETIDDEISLSLLAESRCLIKLEFMYGNKPHYKIGEIDKGES